MRSVTDPYWPFTLDAANEDTKMIRAKDFRNAIFTVVADNSAACTLKFYTSNQEARPDLDSAASATNEYATTEVIDLESGDGVDWDTGVVYAWSSDGVHKYEMNTNLVTWVGVIMTARTAWDVTITISLGDNK